MNTKRRGNGQGTLYKRNDRGCWIARWCDHDGKRQEKSTRTTDKAAAARILGKHVTDTTLRREGVIDSRTASVAAASKRPIEEHLTSWRQSLELKGITAKRIDKAVRQAAWMARGRFATLAEITPSQVTEALNALKREDYAASTINERGAGAGGT